MRRENSIKTHIRDAAWFAAYAPIRVYAGFLNILPLDTALRFGGILGSLAYILSGREKAVMKSIRSALGKEKSAEEISSIARSFYRKLGMNAVEVARLKRLKRAYVDEHIRFDGLHYIDEAIKKGRGVILLAAHFGNWELLSAALALRGYATVNVVRPLDNPYLNAFIEERRTFFGTVSIAKKNALKKMLAVLRENKLLGILLDQRAGRSEAVTVDFFGIPAPTSKGLAMVAAKTGSPVLPIFIRRESMKGHVVTCLPPVDIADTGNKEDDVKENTRRFNSAIEGFIRAYPDEWFWFHSRWERRKKQG